MSEPQDARRARIEAALATALRAPELALVELDRASCVHFPTFVKKAWPHIEPGKALKWGWALDVMCDHLEAAASGSLRRLLINVPPGFMKSILLNVMLPAYTWGPGPMNAQQAESLRAAARRVANGRPDGLKDVDRAWISGDPTLRTIGFSYTQDLTIRDNRKLKSLVKSDWYKERWPEPARLVKDADEKFENARLGWSLATSVGGVGTGERGDLLRVDDPHKVGDADSDPKRYRALMWFSEELPTRVNDPDTCAIVVIMQRVHEDDVSGLILSKELGYCHLALPMEYDPGGRWAHQVTRLGFRDPRTKPGELLFPERFSRKHIEEELKPQLSAMDGDYAFAGQMQQDPYPRGGGMFKVDELTFRSGLKPPRVGAVAGWDLAATNNKRSDRTSRTLMWRDGDQYVIGHCEAFKKNATRLFGEFKRIVRQDARTGARVLHSFPNEPGAAGEVLARAIQERFREWRDDAEVPVRADVECTPETGDKAVRARPLAEQIAAGRVTVAGDPEERWVRDMVAEFRSFPRGRYDDRIDSASRAYARLRHHARRGRRHATGGVTVVPSDDDSED